MIRKLYKFGIPLIALVAVLVAVPVLTAAALPGKGKTPANCNNILRTVQGEVINITGNGNPASIEVSQGDAKTIIVTVNTTTEYYIGQTGPLKRSVTNRISILKQWIQRRSGRGNNDEIIPGYWDNQFGRWEPSSKKAAFTDLTIGDRIIARVDSSQVASRILIVEAPAVRQVKGIVTIGTETISILTANGIKIDGVKWGENTRYIIMGSPVVPTSRYGIVVYNSETMTAIMVNLAVKEPTTP